MMMSSVIIALLTLSLHTSYVDLILLLIPISILFKSKHYLNKLEAALLFLIPFSAYIDMQVYGAVVLYIISVLILVGKTNKTKTGGWLMTQ
jgi:hypothetical protein